MTIQRFSELEVGQEIPQLEQFIDKLMIVKYCAAADDWGRVHWDETWVIEQGFPTLVTQGWLTFALMSQAVTNWIPLEIADICKYAVRYKAPTFTGKLTCGGTIVAKHDDGNEKLINLELWARNEEGTVTTTATMTMVVH